MCLFSMWSPQQATEHFVSSPTLSLWWKHYLSHSLGWLWFSEGFRRLHSSSPSLFIMRKLSNKNLVVQIRLSTCCDDWGQKGVWKPVLLHVLTVSFPVKCVPWSNFTLTDQFPWTYFTNAQTMWGNFFLYGKISLPQPTLTTLAYIFNEK